MPHIAGLLEFTGASKKTQPKVPTNRTLGGETNQIYDQTVQLAPKQTALNLQNLNYNLKGDPQNPGWLSLFQNEINPALANTKTATLTGQAGPTVDAIRSLNPAGTALYDTLAQQAATDLAAGSKLRPEDTYQITKSITGDYANRGFTGGLPASQLEQAMQLYGAGQNVQDNRRAFASNVVNQGNQLFTQPTLAAINPEATVSQSLSVLGAGQADSSKLFDQLLGYGSDVFNTNYNAQAGANIAGANNRAAILGGAQSY